MHVLRAIGSSQGIAVGQAWVMYPGATPAVVEAADVEHETALFRKAQRAIERELLDVVQRAQAHAPTLASIVETHVLIVNDPVVSGDIEARIATGESAGKAIELEFSKQARLMLLSTNSLIRDRATDIEHVKQRFLAEIQPTTHVVRLEHPHVIVASTLTPAEMFRMAEQGALGFVFEEGGIDSHISIIARELGLPALVAAHDATRRIQTGQQVIVDAAQGECIIAPTDNVGAKYNDLYQQERIRLHNERMPVLTEVATTDSIAVDVLANVDTPAAADLAHSYGAKGIGLVRTELMLSGDGTFPSVDEQSVWYAEILQRCPNAHVTFRAFDIGGDKFGNYSPYTEQNPVLGLRGIRFLLAQPGIFEQQVRAILRVAAKGRTRLMLPMITSYMEIVAAREIIDACRVDVESEYDSPIDLPVGIMIETPAAAVMADLLAPYVDFISIGTNDLTQYTLAADRTNELVSNMFDCIHPSVIRLMSSVVRAADNAGISVSVCGEMAAQLSATDILLGIGVRSLSVTPHMIPELQRRIQGTSIASCRQLVDSLASCKTSSDVRAAIAQYQSNRQG
ncbi:MAG: Phosphotransferase system enzyme [Bacteroidota bacterium]